MSAARADDTDSYNDFGAIGLIQDPTARFAADGGFGFGIAHVTPYNQAHFQLQFLPWMETVLRYTDVTNRPYGGPVSFSGHQSYKDRSADFKLRLVQEGDYLPEIAMGVQDFGGTGLFSSEYFVATRRYYDVDLTFGLAWGRLGSAGGIKNPFSLLSSHFNNDRYTTSSTSTPGGIGFQRLFTGRTVGPFGGFRWQTPIDHLAARFEYDGNDYKHEALGEMLPQRSPLNFGMEYKPIDSIDLGLGYERGNTVSFSVQLATNFEKVSGMQKFADPPPPPIHVREQGANSPNTEVSQAEQDACESSPTMDAIRAAIARQGFTLYAAACNAARRSLNVWLIQNVYHNDALAIGRTARALTQTAPDWVEQFTIIETSGGLETDRTSVLRKDIENFAEYRGSPEEIAVNRHFEAPQAHLASAPSDVKLIDYPKFSADAAPGLRQQLGGPSGFDFVQVWAKFYGDAAINSHLSFSSVLGINIYNDFGAIHQTSDSELPHVRSDVVKYLQQGPNALIRLEGNYLWSPASQWYARFSAGIFEEMYGGVAGEVLYRPADRDWAVGLDSNWVKKRGFDERFDFQNYQVVTGHLNFYYQLPIYHLFTRISVGRYLAGDHGATIDLARSFHNGVVAGLFATRTDVSAQQFGEGSFDKGVYISLPLDLLLPKSSRQGATFVFRPTTRDGGQEVRDGTELYAVVGGENDRAIIDGWPDIMR